MISTRQIKPLKLERNEKLRERVSILHGWDWKEILSGRNEGL